jgi:hypothetical protein
MSAEQRRDPRIAARQALWCEGQSEKAETRNVSRSGMFIVAEEAREVGEQFKVAFEGDEGEIEVKMEVMWRGEAKAGAPTGMGLRIVGFDKGEDAYERFVARQLENTEGETDPKKG